MKDYVKGGWHDGKIVKYFPEKKYGWIAIPGYPNIHFALKRFCVPEIYDGKLQLGGHYDAEEINPREGARVVIEVLDSPKGLTAIWGFLTSAAKVMRENWVANHDKCPCGHLLTEHNWATGHCFYCSCGDEIEDLDHPTTTDPTDYTCPNCGAHMNGNEVVQECPNCGYGTEAWDHRNDEPKDILTPSWSTGPGGMEGYENGSMND